MENLPKLKQDQSLLDASSADNFPTDTPDTIAFLDVLQLGPSGTAQVGENVTEASSSLNCEGPFQTRHDFADMWISRHLGPPPPQGATIAVQSCQPQGRGVQCTRRWQHLARCSALPELTSPQGSSPCSAW